MANLRFTEPTYITSPDKWQDGNEFPSFTLSRGHRTGLLLEDGFPRLENWAFYTPLILWPCGYSPQSSFQQWRQFCTCMCTYIPHFISTRYIQFYRRMKSISKLNWLCVCVSMPPLAQSRRPHKCGSIFSSHRGWILISDLNTPENDTHWRITAMKQKIPENSGWNHSAKITNLIFPSSLLKPPGPCLRIAIRAPTTKWHPSPFFFLRWTQHSLRRMRKFLESFVYWDT